MVRDIGGPCLCRCVRTGRPLRSPRKQKQDIGGDKNYKANEGGKQVKKIDVAYREVDSQGGPKTSASHHRNDLHQAPVEFRTSGHEEQQASDRAESSAKPCPVMGDDGN